MRTQWWRQLQIRTQPLGDRTVRVTFPQTPSAEAAAACVAALSHALSQTVLEGLIDWTPAYDTVAVSYDPLIAPYHQVAERLAHLARALAKVPSPAGQLVEIPVRFDDECGLDLSSGASELGMSVEELVRRFTEPAYTVRMIGFLPGFPYLSGLPEELALPRLANPRARVPAGSVAVAGRQAGIYPFASPGGWRVLGRTDFKLFDANSDPPACLVVGDRVRFVPIR